MMSNKWTFSLTSLITIIALAFVVTPAMADVLGDKFGTTITLLGTGDDAASAAVLGDNVTASGTVQLRVVFDKRVTTTVPTVAGPEFAPADVMVMALEKETGNPPAAPTVTIADVHSTTPTMTHFNVSVSGLTATEENRGYTVVVTIAAGAVTNDDPNDKLNAGTSDNTLGANAKATLQFDVVLPVQDAPRVVDVEDLPGIVLGPGIHDSFTFKVTLSEKPKEFKKGHIDVGDRATVDGDPIKLDPIDPPEGITSTEARGFVYPYLVTVTPNYLSKDDIVIKIKSFENTDTPTALKSLVSMPYTVKVNSDANKEVGQSGSTVALDKDFIIPKDGYLIVARNTGESYITNPGDAKHGAANIARRVLAKTQTYNMIEKSLGINLEGFLIRGGTIDLVSPSAGLVISEIMWATDAGNADRQWIEIHNTSGAEIKLGDKTTVFTYYEAGEVLPDMSVAGNNIQDRVSTLYKGTNHWSIAGKGQPGRTVGKIVEERKAGSGEGENIAIDIEIVPTDRLISMERAMAADGTYADGTMASSWSQSMPPAQNFQDKAAGLFVGSPGTSAINPVADVVVTPEPEPTPAPVAAADDIMITEIMVDTGDGRLPQWIELTNVSGAEVSLAGWSLMITNSDADADVIGATVSIDLSGTLGVGGGTHAGGTMGKSLLLVGGSARSSSNLADNAADKRVVDISIQVDERGRYSFISTMAFMAALIPQQSTGVLVYGDTAGNLGADEAWELPMSENGRSSLIRREMLKDGTMTMGTDANGWRLASETSLVSGPATWYGSDEDAGTPGYDAGGPLPVELSHFRPARDAAGAVVITWSTQSELNNAGFFIKRSQQRDGQFKVINATMVAGAGTTSEKQFYTYTDTTAQPNIVYYYQIEDVSLDGQRQTLTNGIRLKGHIGAAGKLTSTWGELKSSNE